MYIQVFLPDRKQLVAAGWRRYQHVPALFGDGVVYLPEPNRYLRELATGEWRSDPGVPKNGPIRKPTPQTLKNCGQYLANFLRWCTEYRDDYGKVSPLDWRQIEYAKHIVEGYQQDMLEGRWGLSELKPGTVNLRGDEATRFLEWAAWRELRPPFPVEKVIKQVSGKSGRHSHGHRAKPTVVRVGRQRANPDDLLLPSREATEAWLSEVERRYGPTKGLMSELILRTGIRINECLCWRADTLPANKNEWRLVDGGAYVEVLIRAGNKGGNKQLDEEGELTRHPTGRRIHLPIALAEKLNVYADTTRLIARARYVRAENVPMAERNRRAREKLPLRLFLGDYLGVPFTAQTLRNVWKCPSRPMDEWSPHLGRHYYACYFLLARIEEQAAMLKKLDRKTAMLVASSPAFVDNYWQALQQQLGHVDKETTERYTKWLRQATSNFALSLLNRRPEPLDAGESLSAGTTA